MISTIPSTSPATTAGTRLPDPLAASARHFWDGHHLLEDLDAGQVYADTARLCEILQAHGARTLGDVISADRTILQEVACVTIRGAAMTDDDRERMHRARNTLAAVLATVTFADSPWPVPEGLYQPPPRPGGHRRPATDDEILLFRITASARSRQGGRHHTPSVAYVLTEAGARPSETTVVTPSDFDHPRLPTRVKLPGKRKGPGKRGVDLPLWGRHIVSAAIDAHLGRYEGAAGTPVAYDGRSVAGGSDASASASGNLKRHMSRSGVEVGSLVPTSIAQWRIAQILDTSGIDAAYDVLGVRRTNPVEAFIRRATEDEDFEAATPGGYA